jgi:hypothetical protein
MGTSEYHGNPGLNPKGNFAMAEDVHDFPIDDRMVIMIGNLYF